MGRIKEISRKSSNRRRRSVIYIICEGTETEPRYFKQFRTRYCNIDIYPISSQYRAADRLVEKVFATLGGAPYFPDEGDQIWCVFDRDDNTDQSLAIAEREAQKHGYHIAFSNPSFEYWYLLHFINYRMELNDCDAVIRQLKHPDRLPDYGKSGDIYSKIKPNEKKAIDRARDRLNDLRTEHIRLLSRASNPSTSVVELVEFLNQKTMG